jgi:acetyl esterase/lipase
MGIEATTTAVDTTMMINTAGRKYRIYSHWAGLALFLYGWVAVIGLCVRRDWFFGGHVCLSFCLCPSIRIPPPMAEIPFLVDPGVMVVVRNDLWIALLMIALSAFNFVSSRLGAAVLFLMAGVMLLFSRGVAKSSTYFIEFSNKRKKRRECAGEGVNGGISTCSSSSSLQRPNTASQEPLVKGRLPWLISAHPFAFIVIDFPEDIIKVDAVEIPLQNIQMEIWRLRDSAVARKQSVADDGSLLNSLPLGPQQSASTPIMFFVHGGGWKSGSTRMHSQVRLLYDLIIRGWTVICCGYRKSAWPLHVTDTMSCLEYVILHASDWNGSKDNIHLSGASAGGHIVSQIVCDLNCHSRAVKNGDRQERGHIPFKPASLVLIYPVTDPFDKNGHAASFPVSFPYLGVRARQSLLSWFFETAIMKFQFPAAEFLNWAPLSILDKEIEKLSQPRYEVNLKGECVSEATTPLSDSYPLPTTPSSFYWPRTLVVHGDMDSVVPVEQSMLFVNKLQEFRVLQGRAAGRAVGARKGESEVDRFQQPEAMTDDRMDASIKLPVQELVNRRSPAAITTVVGGTNIIDSCGPDGNQFDDNDDEFLLIPGGKHSFELLESTFVNSANSLIIDWLQH